MTPPIDVADKSDNIVSVDAIPETVERSIAFDHHHNLDIGRHDEHGKTQDPFDPNIQSTELSRSHEDDVEINGEDSNNSEWSSGFGNVSFLEACASDDVNIEDLRVMLKQNPKVAAVRDEYGDYPAHIFANNDAVIYGEDSDDDVLEFVFELYSAHPEGMCLLRSLHYVVFCFFGCQLKCCSMFQ